MELILAIIAAIVIVVLLLMGMWRIAVTIAISTVVGFLIAYTISPVLGFVSSAGFSALVLWPNIQHWMNEG